jgi:mannose-6-phosphate isomerase-like protein (cupin superfamily)
MVEIAVIKLDDSEKWNRWIIGTPPNVPRNSQFYSEQIQVSHMKNPDRKKFLDKEKEHAHKSPIEEFYFVLEGSLEVEIEDKVVTVNPREILTVPPEKRHNIKDFSDEVEFLVFRVPISTGETKTVFG